MPLAVPLAEVDAWPFEDIEALVAAGALATIEAIVFAYMEKHAFARFLESGRFRTFLRFKKISMMKSFFLVPRPNFGRGAIAAREPSLPARPARRPKMDDFNAFRALGRGGFGKVNACRTYTTGKMYAMKCCHKKHVKKNNGRKLCDNEHLALSKLASPYTVPPASPSRRDPPLSDAHAARR